MAPQFLKFSLYVTLVGFSTLDGPSTTILDKFSRILGFINVHTVIHLYKTLILPILHFASPNWSPQTQDEFTSLNSLPRKLLRYAAAKSGTPMNCDDRDYSEISRTTKVFTIESHQKVNDLTLVAKIVHYRSLTYSK